MTVFGDYEPEDAWHPDDGAPALIANLFRRIALLDGLADHQVRRMDPTEELANRLAAWRTSKLDRTARDEERARQLLEDLLWVRSI